MIAHNVYFRLNDAGPEAVQAMVQDCHAYLSHFPGIVFYAAGTAAEAADETDDAFDVALHVVFRDRESLDAYMTAPRHIEFIDKYRANWKGVRGYDSVVRSAAG
jgi:hypothetical protein